MNNLNAISEKVAEEIIKHISENEIAVTLSEIERTSRQVLQEIGRLAIAKVAQNEETAYPESVQCEKGHEMRYQRMRSAKLYTVHGQCEVKRRYYLCEICHQGKFPLDERLGLHPNGHSQEMKKLMAMIGVQLPYGKGSDLFKALMLLDVSEPSLSKATHQVGRMVIDQEVKSQEYATNNAYLLQTKREKHPPLRLYGSIDAAKILIREAEGHRWRDLKLGAWFMAKGKPPDKPDGEWKIQAEQIHYYADIAQAKQFGSLLWGTGVDHLAHLAKELIFLGDGADWIWNLVAEHYPHAIQILDWFHASEHLMPAAQAAFVTLDEQNAWVSRMKQLMWDGEIELLISHCQQLKNLSEAKVIDTTAAYFDKHRERMRYKYFRNQGYQIGSGTIESAAKQVGLMRMKVPGASWNFENARQVAKARAAYLTDGWQSLPLAI